MNANPDAEGLSLDSDEYQPTSYITALYNEGIIDEQLFSFALFD